jgi:hypothetical protein
MEYIHEVVDSATLESIFTLPFSLKGRLLDVTIKPALVENHQSKTTSASACGCLHSYADSTKIAGEKGAWEQAVIAQYEKN